MTKLELPKLTSRVRIRVYNEPHPENGSQGSKTTASGAAGVLDGRIFPSPALVRKSNHTQKATLPYQKQKTGFRYGSQQVHRA